MPRFTDETRSQAIADLEFVLGEYRSAVAVEDNTLISPIAPIAVTPWQVSELFRLQMLAVAAVNRIAGVHSRYGLLVQEALARPWHDGPKLGLVMGVVSALKQGIDRNGLDSIIELAHRSIFSDYIEMAEHLLETPPGYKEAAAVLLGGTLEAHLRRLAEKAGIGLTYQDGKGESKMKLASRLNDELYGQKAYRLAEYEQLASWLAIRNHAAHGRHAEYVIDQVRLMNAGLRWFITQFPV